MLVLCAVFVPVAFLSGIDGQFYRQFAITIAASTVISTFNSLTLSPALAALLLQAEARAHRLRSSASSTASSAASSACSIARFARCRNATARGVGAIVVRRRAVLAVFVRAAGAAPG